MGSSPKLLLAAPGAGFYYDIDKIVLEYTYNTIVYSVGALKFHISISTAQLAVINRNLITDTFNKVSIVEPTKPIFTDGYNLHQTTALNQSLTISTDTGQDFINGNGTMEVKMWYTIRSFG